MNWTLLDYLVASVLLASTGAGYWVATRTARSIWHHFGVIIAVCGGLLMMWVQLAVGLIGDGSHPANTMLLLVLPLGAAGALLSRFRAEGLRSCMVVVAGIQVMTGAVLLTLLGPDQFSDIMLVTALFAGAWTTSAGFFHLAVRHQNQA